MLRERSFHSIENTDNGNGESFSLQFSTPTNILSSDDTEAHYADQNSVLSDINRKTSHQVLLFDKIIYHYFVS